MKRTIKSVGLRTKWYYQFHEIPEKDYRQLPAAENSPLLDYNWLCWLEDSASISPIYDWEPCHLALWQGERLAALAPLYRRNNSWGEFVFDFMWADAAAQVGMQYYPKLVGMSPVTPSDVYRFLIAPGFNQEEMSQILWQEIIEFMARERIETCAFNWVDKAWIPEMLERDFTVWDHQSFLWTNPGYESFEDYLLAFGKNQRRNIRRERKKVVEAGLEVRALCGREISQQDFLAMYDFYKATNDRFGPWAAKFLNREFFKELHAKAPDPALIFAAYEKNCDKPIAMSFLLFNNQKLIGRYWGAKGYMDSLHFELCYYAPIQWAIEHGIKEFDPGFGSPHKVRRGFRAVSSHSLHYFTHPLMQNVMRSYTAQLNRDNQRQIEYLNNQSPLK